MLIHVKEKEQTVCANYVVVLSMQNTHPYFEWNRFLSYRRISLEKSDGNKAEKGQFLARFGEFKVRMNITHTKKMCEWIPPRAINNRSCPQYH